MVRMKILKVKRFNPVLRLMLASLLLGAAWLCQPPATVTAQTQGRTTQLYSDVRGIRPLNSTPPTKPRRSRKIYSDVRGIGPLNGVEWQIDAPWRIEPSAATQGHAKIPITITFHNVGDQYVENQSSTDPAPFPFGSICGLYVLEGYTTEGEIRPVTVIDPAHFYEIEASLRWTKDGALMGGPNPHLLRRIWNGESPNDVLKVSDWTDWNATVFYEPRDQTPGADIKLIAMARLSRGGPCSASPLSQNEILLQLTRGRESHRMYENVPPPGGPGPVDPNAAQFFFGDFLKVHLAAEPLPRFDGRWVYGDLHYHSQGTDNEGESAINYRGVSQAMKAVGLDYLFATEHASNSDQVTGVHKVFVTDIQGGPWWLQIPFLKDYILDKARDIGFGLPVPDHNALRDMSPQRFAYLYDWLNLPGGVNAQVGASGGPARAPQIFLGGEVDAWPEINSVEAMSGRFKYSYYRSYLFKNACNELPLDLLPISIQTNFATAVCLPNAAYKFGPNEFGIQDPQGFGQMEPARQHIVYLPYHSSEPGAVTGRDAFIPSNTGSFGGADRRLQELISNELEGAKKGYFFLAHPVSASSGSGIDRLGPDMIPYSDVQLERAFRSRYVLGLQFWNENTHFKSKVGSKAFPMLHQQGYVYTPPPGEPNPDPNHVVVSFNWNWEIGDNVSEVVHLSDGGRMWDQVLRWGITPSRTAGIPWLAPGAPRKFFMAGGSDAHGDLNYRREGVFLGWANANDTAIGKPRNLTYVGPERLGGPNAVGQNQVIDHLAQGQFSVTDGPALRIAIDVNGNGIIDDADVPMGGDFAAGSGPVPLLVEWKSTPEFGELDSIDIYVGAQAGSHPGLVYTPPIGAGCGWHGMPECPMLDGYVRDPNGSLRFTVPLGRRMSGVQRIDLRPSDYKLFDIKCTTVPDPDPQVPPSTECHAINIQYPSRLYTRAVATTRPPYYMRRHAYTNPIWMTANAPPSPPTVALQHLGCSSNINTYTVSFTQGIVPGSISAEVSIGGGPFAALAVPFAAPGGQTVVVRARACNASGCSSYTTDTQTGPTCVPPPPPPPPSCSGKCCEFDANGRCTKCIPKGASCP